jgi:hypothetical protein
VETTKVYRLEDENGKGPYSGTRHEDSAAARVKYAHNWADDGTHPCPQFSDGPYYMDSFELSGCASLDSLIAWFDPFIDELLDEGFELVELDVPSHLVRHCSNSDQLVFHEDWRNCHA